MDITASKSEHNAKCDAVGLRGGRKKSKFEKTSQFVPSISNKLPLRNANVADGFALRATHKPRRRFVSGGDGNFSWHACSVNGKREGNRSNCD